MPRTFFVDRGMQWFLGNQGSGVSQFDPSGQVSPGQAYVPDEVAKMIVKEAGLGKSDTISKRAIIGYLESMGLSRLLANDVALALRDSYGVTPTFDEGEELPRSGRLLEELDVVVGESYPAPFMVMGPRILTEQDAYQAQLMEDYEGAVNEEDRRILLALSEVSYEDACEIAMFGEWAGPETLDLLWSLVEDGQEALAHEVLEGIVRPHLAHGLSEDAQALVEQVLTKQDKKQLKRAYKDRDVGAGDRLASKAAARAAGRKVPAAMPRKTTDPAAATWAKMGGEKHIHAKPLPFPKEKKPEAPTQPSAPQAEPPKPSLLKRAGEKAIGLAKKAKHWPIGDTEPGVKGAAKAVIGKPLGAVAKGAGWAAKKALGAAGAGLGAFGGSFAAQAKASYDKQKAIQRGETPPATATAPAAAQSARSSEEPQKKPGLLRRAIGWAGRTIAGAGKRMAQANPGMAQVAQDVASGAKKRSSAGSRRKGRGGAAVSGLQDSVARSGSLLDEMEAVFEGRSLCESEEIEIPLPAAVAEEIEPDDVVDHAVVECLAEMSWDQLAQMASIILMPPEESLSLIRSMAEGTGAFREEWASVEERAELPAGVSRSTFVRLSKISIDEGVVPRVIYWSGRMLQRAGDLVEEYVRESYPELGKTVYGPAGDPRKGPELAKEYMTPYEAGTYAPNAEAKVQDVRMFTDPDDRKARREKRLKEVEGVLKDMETAAKRVGVPPEGLFLNKWRDMQRERVRYS